MSDFLWYETPGLAGVEKRFRKSHLTSTRARLKLQERVERLERELEWTRLIASTLLALCVEKGLVTANELEARIKSIDLSDGSADGELAPGRPLPGSPPLPPPAAPKPSAPRKRFRPRR